MVACLVSVAVLPARAQTSVDPAPDDKTVARDSTTTTRVISSPEVKENISPTSTDSTRPSTVAARPVLSTEIKERLRNFERAREAYLQRQRELEKRLKGATEQERERIREQIKDRRSAWLEQHKQFQVELRERVREIKREIPSLRDALDETRPPARPGLD
jgi:hypothetical protein